VWDDGTGTLWTIDGHQRMKVLAALAAEGWEIPPVPVDYIYAKDQAEAKRLILSASSQYGEWDAEILAKWMAGIGQGIADTLRLTDRELEIILIGDKDKIDLKHENLEPYKKIHVLLSMSPEKFFEIQEYLKQIKDIEGVEYEQSKN